MGNIELLAFIGIVGMATTLSVLVPVGFDTYKHRRNLLYSLMILLILIAIAIVFAIAQITIELI